MRTALHHACSRAAAGVPDRSDADGMPDVADVSGHIGAIYDAALDPALWPVVVERMTRFVGGFSACLSIRDRAAGIAHVTPYGEVPDPHYSQLYVEDYHRYDPRDWSLFEVGAVQGNHAFLAPEDFAQSRFYREWMAPQGVGDNPICVLDRSPTGGAAYGVFLPKTDRQANERSFERMRLLAPHLRRAAQITKSLEMRKAETERFVEVLDGLAAGVILVDGERRIVHANASGRGMLAQRARVQAVNGRIVMQAAEAQRALHRSVGMAAEARGRAGRPGTTRPCDAGAAGHATTLVLDGGEDGGMPCLAHILPLARSAEPRARRAGGAVAALFVHATMPVAPSVTALIARHYRLTPGEVRVLMAIVDSSGVRETAEALGIAETTVKTHLQRIYSKTGSARQADLVRLVAGFASPLLR